MSNLINPSELVGFRAVEYLDEFQALNIAPRDPGTSVSIFGTKVDGEAWQPSITLTWPTDQTGREIFEALGQATGPGGMGEEKVGLCIYTSEHLFETDWCPADPPTADISSALADFGITVGDNIIVNASATDTSFKWAFDRSATPNTLSLDTAESLSESWLWQLIQTTGTLAARELIEPDIDRLAACVDEFLQTPYGFPTLTSGFTPENS